MPKKAAKPEEPEEEDQDIVPPAPPESKVAKMRPTVSVKPHSATTVRGVSRPTHTTTLAILEAQGEAETTLKVHSSET